MSNLPPGAQTEQCYRLDGTDWDDTFAPCNPNAAKGEFSACCRLRGKQPADLCMSSGLCFAQDNGMIYSNGCTDSSGKDVACPQICTAKVGDATKGSWVVRPCSQGKYCCSDDTTDCCQDENNVFGATIGTILLPPAAGTGTGSGPVHTTELSQATQTVFAPCNGNSAAAAVNQTCPGRSNNVAVVGGAVGGVLGSALLASLGVIAYLMKKRSSKSPEYQTKPNTTPPVHELGPEYVPSELQGNHT